MLKLENYDEAYDLNMQKYFIIMIWHININNKHIAYF